MPKKTKITLTLSGIAVALAIGAQYYTNYKIDQVLQNFPYHLRDQITLNVTQNSSHFFSRDLTFSLIDDTNKKTDIIHTKLTALPFAITAESELPPEFIKELNKKLQVTIDKNVINSKFSVIGDYLQSSIQTHFRDLTNTQQTLEMDLNFASKTKFMEIQTTLSGFNYNASSKISGINSHVTLIPINQSQYDIADLDFKIKNADIYLLNGENTYIGLTNFNYQLNKSNSSETYDLKTKIHSEKLTLSNKYNQNEKIEFNTPEISINQIGVPNNILFSDLFRTLAQEKSKETSLKSSIDLAKITHLVTELLFNNKKLEFTLSTKDFSAPKIKAKALELKNASIAFVANNQEKDNVEWVFKTNLGQLTSEYFDSLTEKTYKMSLSDLDFNSTVSQVDLSTRLAMLEKTIQVFSSQDKKDKTDPQFADLLEKLTTNFKEKTALQLNMKSFAVPEKLDIKGLALEYIEEPLNDKDYKLSFNAKLDKYIDVNQSLQVNNFELNLPVQLASIKDLLKSHFCQQTIYMVGCAKYLDKVKNDENYMADIMKSLGITIENLTAKANIDTYPNTKAGDISWTLSLKSPPVAAQLKDEDLILEDRENNLVITSYLSLPNTLVSADKKVNNYHSHFWYWIYHELMPYDRLNPYFQQKEDNLILDYQQKHGETWINGKNLTQIEQEIEQQNMQQIENEWHRIEEEELKNKQNSEK